MKIFTRLFNHLGQVNRGNHDRYRDGDLDVGPARRSAIQGGPAPRNHSNAITIASTCLLLALVGCTQIDKDACATGESCMCTDGTAGTQTCQADGTLAACVCSGVGSGSCTVPSKEYCDGRDNDCNGIIDDGEVCPASTVANTKPFSGGVYFQGTRSQGSCGTDALQRFWPTLATSYFTGFDCYASWYRFRRSDAAIYYQATFSGIRENTDTTDPVVSTSPCNMDVGKYFDFDAAGTFYYQCSDTVRRAGGAVVAQSVRSFVATLDDGRILATRDGAGGTDFVVLDKAGRELSRLSPFAAFAGTMTPALDATTVAGNSGYVAYLREYADHQNEIVVFRVDESSTWAQVRRVGMSYFGSAQLVLSDGTVFIREQDPDNPSEVTERIVAFLPDGTSRVAWREVDVGSLRTFIGDQILAGPP